MNNVLKFIGEHFSIYAIFLLLFCSYMLIYVDRKHLKANGLKKEAKVSFISGIIYAVLGIVLFITTQFFTPIR